MSNLPNNTYHTTMVMVENNLGEVLLIDRKKSWKGLTFPGGHVLENESITQCAIREIKEETNIDICEVKLCGLINWYNVINNDRFLVYCFKAKAKTLDLKCSKDEGEVYFRKLSSIEDSEFSLGFKDQIPIFTDDNIIEYYGTYGTGTDSPLEIFRSK